MYGVATASVAEPRQLTKSDPLQPFEQDQLNRLISQLNATSPRVKTAFLKYIRSNRIR